MHKYTHIYIHTLEVITHATRPMCTYRFMYTDTYICIYVYIYMYIYIGIYICMYIYVYTICMYVYIYIYICIQSHKGVYIDSDKEVLDSRV